MGQLINIKAPSFLRGLPIDAHSPELAHLPQARELWPSIDDAQRDIQRYLDADPRPVWIVRQTSGEGQAQHWYASSSREAMVAVEWLTVHRDGSGPDLGEGFEIMSLDAASR